MPKTVRSQKLPAKSKPVTKHRTPLPKSSTQKSATIAAKAQLGKSKRLNRTERKQQRATYALSRVRLPNVWNLSKITVKVIWRYKFVLLGIALIYGVLDVLLVQSSGASGVGSLKSELNQAFKGNFGHVASGLTVFAVLIDNSGNSIGAYQIILILLTSLAVIWSLRQSLAGHHIRLRDAYYKGLYPLVPFILVLIVMAVQLIPMIIGGALYSEVINNGIAVGFIEKFICFLIFALTALLSLYWLSSSLFALYVVTLPDMTPLKALRSARELVRFRRWPVMRKVLFLPLALVIIGALVMVPIILVATALAQWVFYILTLLALIILHSYIYTLYRELLNEKISS